MEEKTQAHYRFYLRSGSTGRGDAVRFSEEESKHMVSSLRMGEGDLVGATDGNGSVFTVEIGDVAGKRVKGRILEVKEERRPQPEIHLFLGVIKGSHMDLVVEKCTELGVAAVWPVHTERVVSRLSSNRLERLRRIAVETMKQSLGSYLPGISEALAFEDALGKLRGFDVTLAGWVDEPGRTLGKIDLRPGPMKIGLWIGPEGGFTDREITSLVDHGALTFSLGDQRLKAETAALASVAILRQFD
ncbi:MAG: 16S rRNA (uracil(1498)-N(3))-methyltransferase [bacterium]